MFSLLRRWWRPVAVVALALAPIAAFHRSPSTFAADPPLPRRALAPFVSADPEVAPTPAPTPTRPAAPEPSPAPGAPAGTTFVLNEVRFAPPPGTAPFVELRNTGAAPSSPAGLVLAAGSATYVLPAGAPGAAPGGVVVVIFDGGGATAGVTVHAAGTLLVGAGGLSLHAGSIELDRVTWSDGSLAPGGGISEPAAGSVAARVPAGGAAGTPWALLGPGQATPGTANPAPAVSAFATPDGAVFTSGNARVSWYSVPGATQYRVEVSANPSFAPVLIDQTIPGARPGALTPESLGIGSLAPGLYRWRVTALYPSGAAAVSPSQRLGIRAGANQAGSPGEASAAAATPEKRLPVPQLNQRKDTAMLQLENPTEGGALAWDKPDADQPTRPYCVYAAIAMLNRFFGGDWSVDYAHYVTLKDQAPGPERDLQERGATIYEERTALHEALGVDPGPPRVIASQADLLTFHATIKAEIDAGRPLAAIWPGHAVLVIGYGEEDEFGNFSIVVQDGNGPAWARSQFPDAAFIWLAYLTIPAGASGADQGKVTTDSDGDGVVDFDESDRFHTSSGRKDSDHDKLDDKPDIRASVWDERHGYARGGPGRDFDDDGIPMERDADADDGGCFDGMEDANKDGKFDEGSELDNFERGDDPCIGGTVFHVLETFETYDDGGTHYSLQESLAVVSLESNPDGTLRGTASVTYFIEAQTVDPDCTSTIPRVTASWAATLTGEIIGGTMQFTAEPIRGATMTITIVSCFGASSYDTEPVPFVGWGNIVFTDGRYQERFDVTPPVPGQVQFYTEVRLHQPGH
jgi:hypothetical protein